MPGENENWVSISLRPTHGTATPVSFPSATPIEKREKEIFWARELLSRLPEMAGLNFSVLTNADDSDGKPDVIVTIDADSTFGIQVKELTYELWRKRSSQRDRFLNTILTELRKIGINSQVPLVAKIILSPHDPIELDLPKACKVAEIIASSINQPSIDHVIHTSFGRLYFTLPIEGQIYVPTIGNIGIDVEFDQLPRSLEMYRKAVDYLKGKKQSELSPWLIIWSTAFHLDRHTFGDAVLEYLRLAFLTTSFSHVYFIESIDGSGFFETNIKIYPIKCPSNG